MPKIRLKPHSPEFADPVKPHSKEKRCDMPYCPNVGTFRAPKDRSLSEHYWFCQDHITEYNRAWNFFDGMNPKEVEDHILKSMFGDRPTWRYDMDQAERLRQQAWEFYGMGENPDEHASRAWQEYEQNGRQVDQTSQEFEAMAIFGLEPPINEAKMKERYKELAKKYHPDRNRGCEKSEEMLKKVNVAYTVLKLAFQKYDQLDKV